MAEITGTNQKEDLIRYDILVQRALRRVVKNVIQKTAQSGLPGNHHFYITFNTCYAGVHLSKRMLEKYPQEMTIVIQHQFWDFKVTENSFSIGLSFNNIPENLLVPFESIVSFFDPSIPFSLQFDGRIENQETIQPLTVSSEKEKKDSINEGVKRKKIKIIDESENIVFLDAFRKK
ncbi:SspB family protein [Candidatus Endowatersipora endosymbiont of Watersipora subatra]|uniref:SspB family protein n=1 Tax=Candidatus Endowatersipora endosymbiont of Watersipora subatra TaxID=3077946 RepID=UPI00312C7342